MERSYYLLIFQLAFFSVFGAAVLKVDVDKIRGGRIIGGEDTTIEAFPHQASLHFFHTHLCGASIISARWLVTASHCTTLDLGFSHTPIRGFTVRMGTGQLEAGGQEIAVVRVYDHPLYLLSEPVGYDYDISLLYLEREITFSTTIQPIRLAESDEVYLPNTTATVIGWGLTTESGLSLPETLQKVDVPLVSNADCENMFNTWNIYGYITDRMICAGFAEGGYDACGGDSGGPLIVNSTLVGVVSFGNGCARESAPGVYTSIQSLREWIRETTGI